MDVILWSILTSASLSILIVWSNALHGRFTNDHDFHSVQKFHANPVPRIGGVALLVSLSLIFIFCSKVRQNIGLVGGELLYSSLPIVLVGLLEDITKKMPAKFRLYISFFTAAMVFSVIHVHFTRIDIRVLDQFVFSLPLISFVLTLLVIGGTVHALNLIDGFNGLMLGVSMLMFAAIAIVSYWVQDDLVFYLSLACLGTIGGLFIVNFPMGKIFAGDSGAYFIGYLLGTITLMLVERNREVSAWFPCLLLIYPIFETLFSIYRKVFIRQMPAMKPDGIHLHMLVYKRIARHKFKKWPVLSNSMTSPYLWLLSLIGIVPAVIFWKNTSLNIVFCVVFAVAYLRIYWHLVLFGNQTNLLRSVKYPDRNMSEEMV